MTMQFHSFRLLPLLAAGLLFAASSAFAVPAQAETVADRIVGADGALYAAVLLDGSAGSAPSVALDTAEGRLVVPSTDDAAVESGVHLEWSRSAGKLLLLWTSTDGDGISRLRFATYSDGAFSEVTTLRDAREDIRFSSPPTVVADHQRLTLELEEDGRLEADRHLFHVFWIEESSDLLYTVLLFENGRTARWHETVALTGLFEEAHRGTAAKQGSAPIVWNLRQSETGDSLLVSFDDPDIQRIGTLEISVIAPALGLMSEAIAEHVLDLVAENADDTADSWIDKMLAHIVVIGNRLLIDPLITDFFADRIGQWLHEHAGDYAGDPQSLAAATRRAALEVSQSVSAVTLPGTAGESETTGTDFATYLQEHGQSEELSGLVSVRVAADFPTPLDGLHPDDRIHVADDGSAVALARQANGALLWMENRGDGWSAVRRLVLGEGLDGESAHELVARSVR